MINFIFNGILDVSKFKTLCLFLNKKIKNSELTHNSKGYFYEILRVFKYLHQSSKKVIFNSDKSIHLSLSYYSFEYPKEYADNTIVSLDDLPLGFFKKSSILFKFFMYILLCKLKYRKTSPIVMSSVFIGFIYHERINILKQYDIHFYSYSYVLDVVTLCYFLKENPCKSITFHEPVNFLDESNSIIANSIYFNNNITKDYAIKNSDKYQADNYYFVNSCSEISIIDSRIKSIGYYSEGYYNRPTSFVNKNAIELGRRIEKKILKFLRSFAMENRDINITIYPHYHRGVESLESAKFFYEDTLKETNINLNPFEKKSSDTFSAIDLGVVVRSNIFWDRLFEGRKTFLISPFLQSEILNEKFFADKILDIMNDKQFSLKFKKLILN